jgi:hypothetical protein
MLIRRRPIRVHTTVGLVELDQEGGIGTLGEAGLFVEQRQDAKLALNEIQALGVVNPVNVGPVDALAVVLKLLEREDVAVEVLLQLLVCVVDVELLKVVVLRRMNKYDILIRRQTAKFSNPKMSSRPTDWKDSGPRRVTFSLVMIQRKRRE